MKNNTVISVSIIAIAVIISAAIIAGVLKKRINDKHRLYVKGVCTRDFKSDLIVWEGEFESTSNNLQEAYAKLQRDKNIVYNYLKKEGLSDTEIVFKAIDVSKIYDDQYDKEGNLHSVFQGYKLTEGIEITSRDVEKIENISRKITELFGQDVYFTSYAPRYYYTKLNDLKIAMIADATKNARQRAEQIVKNAGGNLGSLISAKLGVFQIVGQYSDEDYTWGGTFNTSSKYKTASITVSLVFIVK